MFSKRVLLKLKKDAPKYEGKILKEPLLIVYKGMYLARRTRSNALRKLSRLLGQREIIQEVIAQLTDCNESLWAERNKRQVLPPPPPQTHTHVRTRTQQKQKGPQVRHTIKPNRK